MILETVTAIIGLCSTALPTWAWNNERKNKKLLELEYNIRVAQSLGQAATLRDHDTGVHNYRVTYLSSIFGEILNLDKKNLQGLMKGAFLHDVGKIGIPDKILLKNAKLDEDEWLTMRLHPILGKELLEQMPWFSDALSVVIYHHEKFDGTGYPFGLAKNSIPLNARIFSIIDVFDALISKRPYKESFDIDYAINIIENGADSHFDPMLVKIFCSNARDFFKSVFGKSEEELKSMLINRRKIIFGI